MADPWPTVDHLEPSRPALPEPGDGSDVHAGDDGREGPVPGVTTLSLPMTSGVRECLTGAAAAGYGVKPVKSRFTIWLLLAASCWFLGFCAVTRVGGSTVGLMLLILPCALLPLVLVDVLVRRRRALAAVRAPLLADAASPSYLQSSGSVWSHFAGAQSQGKSGAPTAIVALHLGERTYHVHDAHDVPRLLSLRAGVAEHTEHLILAVHDDLGMLVYKNPHYALTGQERRYEGPRPAFGG